MAFAQESRPARGFFRGGSKPYVRWWWLAGPFCEPDIETQLDWVKRMGFGGVELAWLWPGWITRFDPVDIPIWLGPDWSRLVAHAKRYADRIGLGCDFTFGSCWPFGGSCVARDHASQTFDGSPTQYLEASWEDPLYRELYVVDHLNREALFAYGQAMLPAFQAALEGAPSGLFCDSLEIDARRLWSPALWDEFARERGYRLEPFCNDLDRQLDVRYDYRKFLAGVMVREFYAPFTQFCHEQGAFARVQCHGSPTDLLTCYSAVDVPESEALLFDPPFSRIPASAAALGDRAVVSCRDLHLHIRLHQPAAHRSLSLLEVRTGRRPQAPGRRRHGQRRQPDRLARHALQRARVAITNFTPRSTSALIAPSSMSCRPSTPISKTSVDGCSRVARSLNWPSTCPTKTCGCST